MLSPVQTAEASLYKVEIRTEHEQKLLRLTVRKWSYLVANKHIFLSMRRHQSDSPFVCKCALPRIKYFNSTQEQSQTLKLNHLRMCMCVHTCVPERTRVCAGMCTLGHI